MRTHAERTDDLVPNRATEPPPGRCNLTQGLAPSRDGDAMPRLPSGARELDLSAPVQRKSLGESGDEAQIARLSGLGPTVQRRLSEHGAAAADPTAVHAAAAHGTQGSGGALPHLDAIQRSFGRHDVSGIVAHAGAEATEGAHAMGAEAFAFGDRVAFAGTPTLHTAAHEAAHVVQQRAGVHLEGGVGEAHDVHERHADAVADLVVQGRSAEALLDERAPAGGADRAVQRALVATAHGYHVDDREAAGTQHFTAIPGGWQDQNNYRFNYTANEELLVTHAPGGGAYAPNRYWDAEHQIELRRDTRVAGNGANLHIYYRVGGANWNDRLLYGANHRYQAVPTNRVHWIDANGRYVDQYDRVLAPNGQGVDKQYAAVKEGRNHVVPFKDMNQAYTPGLPGVFGGNIDPGENAGGALGREIDEESGGGVTLNAMGAQLMQQQAAMGDTNRYTINRATVTTQAPIAAPHEMAGTFNVTASQFVGHTATANATKQRLLALFLQHAAADPTLAAHAHHVQHLSAGDLNTWMQSHGITALAAAITQDVASYQQGRDRARTSQLALIGANADHQAGFNMYQQGVTDARAGLGVQQGGEPAYVTAHADYLLGLAAGQQGLNAHAHAGYTTGRTDYAQGLAAAQQNGAAAVHLAFTTARTEYTQGWQAARDHLAAPVAHVACTTAHTEYGQGLAHAGANQAAASNHVAYMQGYQSFI